MDPRLQGDLRVPGPEALPAGGTVSLRLRARRAQDERAAVAVVDLIVSAVSRPVRHRSSPLGSAAVTSARPPIRSMPTRIQPGVPHDQLSG